MIGDLIPSQVLEAYLGQESKDFAVQAGRLKTFKQTIGLFIFSIIWIGFTSIFVFVFAVPLFTGGEVNFESNGVPTTASLDNLGPLLMPGLIIGLFLLIGFGILGYAIYCLTAKGSNFIGTSTRLVIQRGDKIRSIDWEQFNGDITLSGNDQKGDLVMKLRTGKMVSQKNRGPQYVPDVISLPAIPFPREIEAICRKHIKENDPTPVGGQTTQDLPESLV